MSVSLEAGSARGSHIISGCHTTRHFQCIGHMSSSECRAKFWIGTFPGTKHVQFHVLSRRMEVIRERSQCQHSSRVSQIPNPSTLT